MTMTSKDISTPRNALIGAGLLLAASASVAGATRLDFIDQSTAERAMGVLLGIVLVVTGNFIPKTLEPMSGERCEPRKQALHRFAGWAFVLAGLGHAAVWLILPVNRANPVAMLIVAATILLVLGRTAWVVMTRKPAQPSPEL